MLDISQVTGTLEQASELVKNVSNTAQAVNEAYVKTRGIIEQGRHYYDILRQWAEALQSALEKINPYVQPARDVWLKITNNNEPKRIVIIILIVLVLFMLWKLRNIRFREHHDR